MRRSGIGARRSEDAAEEASTAIATGQTPNAERPAPSTEQWPTVERRAPTLLACAGTEMPRLFRDDVLCACSVCGASIYHRPWALAELGPHARAACLPCAAHYGARQTGPGAPRTSGMTRRTLVEVAQYLGEFRR